MITAARAEGYVRVFAYRTGQETARGRGTSEGHDVRVVRPGLRGGSVFGNL
jgi:hypothetical protein